MFTEHSLYIVFLIGLYGLAIQQGVEFFDALIPFNLWKRNRKLWCKTAALLIGCVLFRVQSRFFLLRTEEIVVCGLCVAAATEAWNSLLKTMIYAKEQAKATAGRSLSTSGSLAIEAMARK